MGAWSENCAVGSPKPVESSEGGLEVEDDGKEDDDDLARTREVKFKV